VYTLWPMLKRIVSGSLLVAGTTVGAGMLGIPLLTAKAGFWPGLGIIILAWAVMLWTGLLFLEATLWMPVGSNLLSMSKRFLGSKGRAFSGMMFLFLYYCLLVAYFAAGAPMLGLGIGKLVGIQMTGIWPYLLFGLIFGTIVGLGAKWIDRANILLTAGLISAYLLLIGLGAGEVDPQKFTFFDWPKAAFAMPVLFAAFGYHNIIPSLVTYFGKEKKAIRLSIVLGTTLALVIYVIWQWLVLGIIPPEKIAEALREGKPVTAALQSVTGNFWIVVSGQLFAFFALITSLLGVAFSMVDFLADGFKVERHGWKRVALTCITFFPPFALAVIYPTIFNQALGIAGGVGEAILNGLIPISFVWIGCYHKGLKSDLRLTRFNLGVSAFVIVVVMILEVLNLIS